MVRHKATLRAVPNQIAKGGNATLAVCCDRGVKDVPTCNCNPENLVANVFVCDGKNEFNDGGVVGYDKSEL